MTVEIFVRDDISVNTLLDVARTHPVVRSPHVGNNSMYNLFAAKCGFPAVWVDTNIPEKDWNYNPHLLIKDGKCVPLVSGMQSMDTLVTHLVADRSHHAELSGQSISHVHIEQMRRVFPGTNLQTYREFFARHAGITEQVLETVTDADPSTWYRKTNEVGRLCVNYSLKENNGITSWKDIRHDVFLPPHKSGWVVPNILSILLDIVVQSKEADSVHVWMLSGPDFVEYIVRMKAQLSRLYKGISGKLGLYEDVQLHIVPFASFRFAVRYDHRTALDELVRLTWKGTIDRGDYASLAQSCPDLWSQTNKRNYFTQHDMSGPDDIYAPDELQGLPLWAIRELWNRIRSELPSKTR